MKDVRNLIQDIHEVINRRGDNLWSMMNSQEFSNEAFRLAEERFRHEQRSYNSIGMSSVDGDCKRKIWYKVNTDPVVEMPKNAGVEATFLQFFIGDLIESLLLELAEAAGHTVTGKQDTLEMCGIVGHRDAVIDGVTVDIKSASVPSFLKFAKGGLRDNDSFGYISQLSSYVAAGANDPLVTNKTHGAFLVWNKVTGNLHLDYLDLSEEVKNKEKELLEFKRMTTSEEPPERLSPIPQDKKNPEGNTMLPMPCSYCRHRERCWPDYRTFLYAKGPVHLIDVVKEPQVKELVKTPW